MTLDPFINLIIAKGYSIIEQFDGGWFLRFGLRKNDKTRFFYGYTPAGNTDEALLEFKHWL